MTAPVASTPSVRAPRPPANDADSNGAAPFASALDGALNAGRDHDVAAPARRSPQSDHQRPDGDQRRAAGHDRADAATLRQPGTRAHGHGERGTRRAADRDPGRTPADDATTTVDPTDAVETGVPAAVPPVWVLPTAPALPTTSPTDATDAAAAVAGVAAAGAPAPSTGSVGLTPPPVTPGLPGQQRSDDDAPALPPADPNSAAPGQPPVGPATPGVPAPVLRGGLPGAAGVAVSAAATRPSASPSADAAPLPATTADGDSPAPAFVAPPQLLPVGPPPAWARTAATPAPAADAGAPAPADAGTALPDVGAVSAAPAPAGGDSASSDTGDTSRQDPGVPVTDPSAGVVASPSVAPATPVAPVAATTPTTPTTPTAPPAPVATQVATQIVALSQGPDATHSVTLVLHPDNLGPVHVQMTVEQGTVDLTLRGAHEHGRAALMDALPDLRRDLESAGLSCSKLDVDRDTGGSWSSRQQSAQQQAAQQQWGDQSRRQPDWSDGRVRPWSRTADSGDSRQVSAPTTRSTPRGVDFRV